MKDAKYDDLLTQKGGRGFPYLVFLDAEGNLAGKHNLERTVEGFTATGALVRALADAKKKGAAAEEFVLKAELALVDAAGIRKNPKPEGATPEQVKRLDVALANAEVMEDIEGLRGQRDPSAGVTLGKKYAEWKTAGKVPTWPYSSQTFWMLLMDFAAADKNAALFEEGLNALRPKFEKLRGGPEWIQKKEEILKKLKEEGKQ